MHLTDSDLALWAAGFVGHLLLLVVLLVRRRVASFPLFTTLIATNLFRTVTLYFVFRHEAFATYFYTFWSLGVLDAGLQLSVVYEMFSHIFRPSGHWSSDVKRSIVWLACGSVAIAFGLTLLASPPTNLWIEALVIKGSFLSSVLMSGLFVGMLSLSVMVGLPLKTHVARISAGLGVYSMTDVIVEAGHSYFAEGHGILSYSTLSHVRISLYSCCLLYWIIMLWRDAPPMRELPDGLKQQLFSLQNTLEYDLRKFRSGKEE
jgi:hypothetical protein